MRSTAPSGLDGDGIGNPGLRSPQAHCALGYRMTHLRRLGAAHAQQGCRRFDHYGTLCAEGESGAADRRRQECRLYSYLILHLRRLGVATVERAKVGKALKGRSRAGRLDASFRSCPIWVAPSGLDYF